MGKKGFTLIELMIVIAVLAVLAAGIFLFVRNKSNNDYMSEQQNVGASNEAEETNGTETDETSQSAACTSGSGEAAAELVIMGDKQWSSLMSESIPAPAQGLITQSQEVSSDDDVFARRVRVEQIAVESLEQLLSDLNTAGGVEQAADYDQTFQEIREETCGPSMESAESVFEDSGLAVDGKYYYVLTSGQISEAVEIVYAQNIAIITWLIG